MASYQEFLAADGGPQNADWAQWHYKNAMQDAANQAADQADIQRQQQYGMQQDQQRALTYLDPSQRAAVQAGGHAAPVGAGMAGNTLAGVGALPKDFQKYGPMLSGLVGANQSIADAFSRGSTPDLQLALSNAMDTRSKHIKDSVEAGDYLGALVADTMSNLNPKLHPNDLNKIVKYTKEDVANPNTGMIDWQIKDENGNPVTTYSTGKKADEAGFGGIAKPANERMKTITSTLNNVFGKVNPLTGSVEVPDQDKLLQVNAMRHAQSYLMANKNNDTSNNPVTDGEAIDYGVRRAAFEELQRLAPLALQTEKGSPAAGSLTERINRLKLLGADDFAKTLSQQMTKSGDYVDSYSPDGRSVRVANPKVQANVAQYLGDGKLKGVLDTYAAMEGKRLSSFDDYANAAEALGRRGGDNALSQLMAANGGKLPTAMLTNMLGSVGDANSSPESFADTRARMLAALNASQSGKAMAGRDEGVPAVTVRRGEPPVKLDFKPRVALPDAVAVGMAPPAADPSWYASDAPVNYQNDPLRNAVNHVRNYFAQAGRKAQGMEN
jgi:hypothetical protein